MWATHQRFVKADTIDKLFPDQNHLIRLLTTELNLFVYGPTGSGKKLIVSKHFEHLPGIWTTVEYESEGSQKQTASFMTRQSATHVELVLNDSIKMKRALLKKMLSDFIMKLSVDAHGMPCRSTIVMYDLHHLSKSMLGILKPFIVSTCRFVFVSNRLFDMFQCISYRFERRSLNYMASHIRRLCETVNVNQLEEIYKKESGNFIQCIMEYELQQLSIPNMYSDIIRQIGQEYFKKSPNFTQLRAFYYQLLVNNVSISKLIIDIMKQVIQAIRDESLIAKIVNMASKYEHRASVGEREIYHLDAFGVNVAHVITGGHSCES